MTLRAHLATFPPRRELMARAVAQLAPQVEVLHICLNGYETIPAELAAYSNVKPTIPPRDLMDAGKFLPQAFPDDHVLLVDDSLSYPADYAAKLMRFGRKVGLEHNVIGIAAITRGAQGLRHLGAARKLGAVRGVGVLGAGSLLMLGRHLPSLSQVEAEKGAVDIALARQFVAKGVRPWALPREANWLRSTLPENLRGTSLQHRVIAPDIPRWEAEQLAICARYDHIGQRMREWRSEDAKPPRRYRIVRSS